MLIFYIRLVKRFLSVALGALVKYEPGLAMDDIRTRTRSHKWIQSGSGPE